MSIFMLQKYLSLQKYVTGNLIGICLILSNVCFGQTLTLKDNQEISHHQSYRHAILNFDRVHIVIANTGSLDIQDSVINVTITPDNPYFIHLQDGKLTLKKNIVNVRVKDISSNPEIPSFYSLINILKGEVMIDENDFNIDTSYTIRLLATNENVSTNNLTFTHNKVERFHGGLYLINSNNAVISNNTFRQLSFSNIYNLGKGNTITDNVFLFPGNFKQGDAIDVINSVDTIISGNTIASSSSYAIMAIGVQGLTIKNNRLIDSLSYAIYITTPGMGMFKIKNHYLGKSITDHDLHIFTNKNIFISNNFISQNKFGIAGNSISSLTVRNNIFIQKFLDDVSRKFWTNNINLLLGVDNLVWQNNIYKEAFSQEVPGDNAKALQVIVFPEQGGVEL